MMPPTEPLLDLLRAAKSASSAIPVPGLSTALECAVAIAEKAKEIKETRDGCRSLAERAARIALSIYDQLKDCDNDTQVAIATRTQEHVMQLHSSLTRIESLMERRRKMSLPRFILRHAKVAEEVQSLTTELDEAIRTFMLQSHIVIAQRMEEMRSVNARVLQHVDDSARVGDTLIGGNRVIQTGIVGLTRRLDGFVTFDGGFRLFSRENLVLLETIRDASPTVRRLIAGPSAHEQKGRVIRHRAIVQAAGDLSGTQVVVHTYPNRDDRRFQEAVKFAKQLFSPYILRVLGYSRPGDPSEASFLVTDNYSPLVEHLSSMHGTKKLRLYMQMMSEICMAADYLESTDLCQSLFPSQHWIAGRQYEFGLDELVFDHGHGGRVKWARQTLVPEGAHHYYGGDAAVPALQEERTRLLEDLRPVAGAGVGTILCHWLAHLRGPLRTARIPGRRWWRYWQAALDPPQYPVGAWMGRNHDHQDWFVFPCEVAALRFVKLFERVPAVIPWQGSPPSALSDPPPQAGDRGRDYFREKIDRAKLLDIPDSDQEEMCINFEFGGGKARWKRYQFSNLPVGTPLLFQQSVHIMSHDPDTVNRVVRSAPLLSSAGCKNIGLAVQHAYHTETTATTTIPLSQRASPPLLWFFLLDIEPNAFPGETIARGFWSTEKDPASLPADALFDTTPQFERIREDTVEPLATWTQVIGDLVFTIQAKMYSQVLDFGEDELLAFRDFQDTDDSYAQNPEHQIAHTADGENASHQGVVHASVSEWRDEDDETSSTPDSESRYFDAAEYLSETESSTDGDSSASSSRYYDVEEFYNAQERDSTDAPSAM